MSGEVKTLKFAEDKPKDCKFCYFWGGKKKGCTLGGEGNCYYLIKEQPPVQKTKCTDCPYPGRCGYFRRRGSGRKLRADF